MIQNRNHLSLFSGIGGLDLAAEWAGFTTVAFVERDKYCQRVLTKHWPGVPIYGDVVEVVADAGGALRRRAGDCATEEHSAMDGRRINPRVGGGDAEDVGGHGASIAIISGGFPCQPHSVAGKHKASADERDLWGECARITGEFKPRWAVFENVPGLLSSENGTFFARVLGDLAALGYRVGWGVWGANDVGAVHKRDRVFIVAHQFGAGLQNGDLQRGFQREAQCENSGQAVELGGEARGREVVSNPGVPAPTRLRKHGREVHAGSSAIQFDRSRCEQWWAAEPNVGRVANGVPRRVDRLRALGNAVVPQQAYPLFKAIADLEGLNVPSDLENV